MFPDSGIIPCHKPLMAAIGLFVRDNQ